MKTWLFVLTGVLGLLRCSAPEAGAAEGASGPLLLNVSNNVRTVTWPRPLIPALESNRLATGISPLSLSTIASSQIAVTTNGYRYVTSNALPNQFFGLTLSQLSSNALLTATVLNRLAYGPTPDELERVTAIGPQTYIDEQLAAENITQGLPDNYRSEVVNGVVLPPNNGWTTVAVTGIVTATTFYIYLTGPGDAYVDDVQLSLIYTNIFYTTNGTTITTNRAPFLGTNVLVNGDFEQPFSTGWTNVGSYYRNSTIVSTPVCSGTGSLHVVSIAPIGSDPGGGNAVTQFGITGLPGINTNRCVLRFAYLARTNSGSARLNVRLSSGGVLGSDAEAPGLPMWNYATFTGNANATPTFYFYLNGGAGETYIDDVKLVAGTVAEVGPNLLANGDFETGELTNNWQVTANFTNSLIDQLRSHTGSGSLHLVGTAAGGGNGNAVFQNPIPGLVSGQTYTLSFWYTTPTRSRTLTGRLSGSLLTGTVPEGSSGTLKRRLDTLGQPGPDGPVTVNTVGGAMLADLRSWFIQNAVGSPRQLLEILTQFFENHFVTEHSKSFDYLDRYYDDGNLIDTFAADWEYREVTKWRQALLNPNCTFYDLLKISAESPAQIVYLDSVESRGDGNRIANENYARELFELYCMGVDNGYDQLDITAMSRAWTGWSVDIVDRQNVNNPFAPQSRTYGFYPNDSNRSVSNLVGAWTFVFKTNFHGANAAPILSIWAPNASRTNMVALGPKVYPPRLGPPWAGRSYQITLPRRGNTTTTSIQDGYDVITSLSLNLFTAEYISVKLCRLFVHDNFPNPTTTTSLPEYAFYDYTNPNRSAEAELVRRCIVAWDTPGPDGRRGHLRAVLRTIFDSDLFRSHGGSMQKVKTPLEFAISTIRALRSGGSSGPYTATTDGYSISGRSRTASSSPLVRMGTMRLFDRDAPDGYPEAGPPWVSAGTLAERIRFVQTCLMASSGDTNKADGITGGNNNLTDPVALLKRKLPVGNWSNPGAVVDFFLGILYPAEGKANLDLYRLNALAFLDRSEDGTQSSPFANINNTGGVGTPYDTRVRSMVSMLMTLQRFQEQ